LFYVSTEKNFRKQASHNVSEQIPSTHSDISVITVNDKDDEVSINERQRT